MNVSVGWCSFHFGEDGLELRKTVLPTPVLATQGFKLTCCPQKERSLATGWIKVETSQMRRLAGGWATIKQLFRACPQMSTDHSPTQRNSGRPRAHACSYVKGRCEKLRPPVGAYMSLQGMDSIKLSDDVTLWRTQFWKLNMLHDSKLKVFPQSQMDTEYNVRPSNPFPWKKQMFYFEEIYNNKI